MTVVVFAFGVWMFVAGMVAVLFLIVVIAERSAEGWFIRDRHGPWPSWRNRITWLAIAVVSVSVVTAVGWFPIKIIAKGIELL